MKKLEQLGFFLLALLIMSNSFEGNAQGVAINESGNSANASAMLDVSSTNKGLLIPRMDSVQRASISNPATGLLVFQTDGTAGFYYYTGSGWIMLSTTLITQLADADGDTKVLVEENADEDKIRFKVKDSLRMIIDTAGNVGIGTSSPRKQLELTGSITLSSTIDSNGIIYKDNSVFLHNFKPPIGDGNNTFLGLNAGNLSMTSANHNTGIGYNCLQGLTSGSYNTALGFFSMRNIKGGGGNTACGAWALKSASYGSYNSAFGMSALKAFGYNNNEQYYHACNTAIGSLSLFYTDPNSDTNGINNTALGYMAGYGGYYNQGYNNIFLGCAAGINIEGTAHNNIVLGYDKDLPDADGNYQMVLGDQNVIYGDLLNKRVGVGTITPNQKLTLNGDFGIIEGGASPTYHTIFQGGDQSGDITYTLPVDDGASGEVLTTDGSGVLSWSGTGDITAVGSMTSGSVFSGASADNQWLGLGASAGRIEFDDQATDEVNFLNAKVGIGTSAPTEELTINGDIKFASGDGNIFASSSTKSIYIGKNEAGHNSPWSSWLIADGYIQLSVKGGTNKGIRIDDDGYVGVGTDTPSDKFHVHGTDNVSAKIIAGSADTSSLKLFESGDYGFEFQYDGSNDKLHLWSRNYTGNEDIRMSWLKTGYVGLGTTTPLAQLHIANTLDAGLILEADTDNSGEDDNPRLELRQDGGTVQGALGYTGLDGSIYEGTNGNALYLMNEYNSNLHLGANDTVRLTVTYDGWVKIHNLGSGTVYSVNGILTNTAPSDRRLKENITPFSLSLDKVMQLRPVTFNWKEGGQHGIGFIAQELEAVIPELVGENPDGYKGIYTTEMIPYLVKAMQEQQEIINSQQNSIMQMQQMNEELLKRMEKLEGSGN
ncbi:MAG: tail fiber domain-containing protein [Bacteroidales bacterium]|nr:tail fiber domain-containing protein [Bacteroidales bacterium]MCF8375274.1 tail fiber domain-containing protein [Bacteroidales bacterium]MCF8401252.1 tail fiber domain-containing protein [Bacteroidales bacterium]